MPLPDEPRTVKPRKDTARPFLPIIAVDRESRSLFCELTGEIHGWADCRNLFLTHPAAIVAVPGAAHFVAELTEFFGKDPMWQYRATPLIREKFTHDPTKKVARVSDTIVNYFGWKGSSNGTTANRRGRWFYPIDPFVFTQLRLPDLMGGTTGAHLLAWAQDVREWCHANGLHPSPTAGGLGGQLLRDPRFYPAARRKVPRATNARVRDILPGNHYRLYWPEHTPVDATYIDMSSAHHYAAASVTFPCANRLYARGNFSDTETTETPVPRNELWAPFGSNKYNRIIQSFGLFRLQLNVPALTASQFPPPYMEQAGRKRVWVYSNELPMVIKLGADIEGIDAAWTCYERDTGLNRFAQWALAETALMSITRKRWAKVTLLATYGNLAARPRSTEFGYRTAKSGEPREYPAGPMGLPVIAHIDPRARELPTVNVVHRGMIEAEQRRLVLDMARDLADAGHTVVCIYADAVMVTSDTPLGFLPPPWRIDGHLTRVRFYAPTAFTSLERSKMPGIPREDAERARRIAHIRRRS